jgi:hypothetical protein
MPFRPDPTGIGGQAPDGTPKLYFTDPEGILLQIQDMTYCGGGGKLGNLCIS